jgi:hypothetical protein
MPLAASHGGVAHDHPRGGARDVPLAEGEVRVPCIGLFTPGGCQFGNVDGPYSYWLSQLDVF